MTRWLRRRRRRANRWQKGRREVARQRSRGGLQAIYSEKQGPVEATCIWKLNHPFGGVESVPMTSPSGTVMESPEDSSMLAMASSWWNPAAIGFSSAELNPLEWEIESERSFRFESDWISRHWFYSTADTKRRSHWVRAQWPASRVCDSMQSVERFRDEFVSPVDRRVGRDCTLEYRHSSPAQGPV